MIRRSPSAGLRRVVRIVAGAALLGAVALTLAVTVGGVRAFVVESGSMRPTLHVGDLVVSRPVTPDALRPGDIVTFHRGNPGGPTITHRVVAVTRSGAIDKVTTKGDANASAEFWQVRADSRLGLSVFHVRGAGRVLTALTRRWVRVGMLLLASVAATVVLLVRIWRPENPSVRSSRRRRPGRHLASGPGGRVCPTSVEPG